MRQSSFGQNSRIVIEAARIARFITHFVSYFGWRACISLAHLARRCTLPSRTLSVLLVVHTARWNRWCIRWLLYQRVLFVTSCSFKTQDLKSMQAENCNNRGDFSNQIHGWLKRSKGTLVVLCEIAHLDIEAEVADVEYDAVSDGQSENNEHNAYFARVVVGPVSALQVILHGSQQSDREKSEDDSHGGITAYNYAPVELVDDIVPTLNSILDGEDQGQSYDWSGHCVAPILVMLE